MKKRIKYINAFICLSGIFILNGCNNEVDSPVYNPSLVFNSSFEIIVEPYEYIDKTDEITYKVTGDTLPDSLGAQPQFQWNNVPSNINTIALFNMPIMVSGNTIQNPENVIWQWHSGMEFEEVDTEQIIINKVQYLHGKSVINKKVQYETQPLPLQSGLYYWAVWSWDEGGKTILYSSRPFKFRVE